MQKEEMKSQNNLLLIIDKFYTYEINFTTSKLYLGTR